MGLFSLLQGVFKNQMVFNYHLLRWVNRGVPESSNLRRSPHQSKVIITNNVLIPIHPTKKIKLVRLFFHNTLLMTI